MTDIASLQTALVDAEREATSSLEAVFGMDEMPKVGMFPLIDYLKMQVGNAAVRAVAAARQADTPILETWRMLSADEIGRDCVMKGLNEKISIEDPDVVQKLVRVGQIQAALVRQKQINRISEETATRAQAASASGPESVAG